jgi:hypothetical protein
MQKTYECLRPGGYFVLSVDLSLNVTPFTNRKDNQYGRNANIRKMIESASFQLVNGNPEELYDHIQSTLEEFLIGVYPALVQCFVLQKPAM